MTIKACFVLLMLASSALADCRVDDILQTLRPNAAWNIRASQLEWLDTTQTKPTLSEIQTAVSDCRVAEAARATLKAQARLDVKNTLLTQAQRLQALLILLDYDR